MLASVFPGAAMETSWAAEHCRQELHCCRTRRKCCQSRIASRLHGVLKAETTARGRLSTEQGFEGMLSHKNISRWRPLICVCSATIAACCRSFVQT